MAVITKIQARRGTTASWAAANPTLASGEIGFDTTLQDFKIGTGAAAWTALPFTKALATGVLNGDMSAADKAKLDAATQTATATTLAMRNGSGTASFNEVTLTTQAAASSGTRKDYVDTAVATKAALAHTHSYADITNVELGVVDLNTYTTAGDFSQSQNADAVSGTNYPVAVAGLLEVRVFSTFIFQTYTGYQVSNRKFWRAKYSTNWSAWQEMADAADVALKLDAAQSGTSHNPVTSASAARPTGITSVWWATPTEPDNWTAGDFWVVTP